MWRKYAIQACLYGLFIIIFLRLGYWQIVRSESLRAIADTQYQQTITLDGSRGTITTADGYTLVGNTTVYRLFAEPHLFEKSIEEIVEKITPILDQSPAEDLTSTENLRNYLTSRLYEYQDKKWVGLQSNITEAQREALTNLDLPGLGFDPYEVRDYPEASMASHIVGFVGKDSQGLDKGYFGIEGALDKELAKRSNKHRVTTNPFGFFFLNTSGLKQAATGRNVKLTIRRDVQYLAETELQKALDKYGASSGEIIILDPKTGAILANATAPTYHPAHFNEFEPQLYSNPVVSDTYEPGSTFKVLTVAAGIELGMINPNTRCPSCAGPRKIDKYTIKTWNEEYHPDITMTEALAKSDNIAMVYIADLLGTDRFKKFLSEAGIGDHTTLDLEEDSNTPFPQKWGPVELATRSFGQGIVVTSMQLVRAIAAFANDGVMMQPQIVSEVYDPATHQTFEVEPTPVRQLVSEETAQLVTSMMVTAAEEGEAQWLKNTSLEVAGKTGTAQVANLEEGGYYEDKTIASFIGFAPASDPAFVMLVKLTEPTTSPWAAETAAPTWYSVAEKLFILLDRVPNSV